MLLEASRSSSAKSDPSNPIRFVPRQVLLDPNRAAMADLKEHRNKKERRKNKEKKSGKSREPLLSSIAAFLESNGFVRTLSEFRSEAGMENGGPTISLISLEDLFCKYSESSKSPADAATDLPKEIDLGKGDTSINDEGEKAHDASETIHKRKRKQKNETNRMNDTCEAPKDTDSLVLKADVKDETKRKKKHKRSSDAGHEDSNQKDHKKIKEIVEEKIEELNSLTNNSSTLPAETSAEQKGEKEKKKKKKRKLASNCTTENGTEESAKEVMIKSASGGGKIAVSEENTEKKSHRKRKKAPEDSVAALAENEIALKVSKHAKAAGDENNKERGTLPQSTKPDGELATIDEKNIEKSTEKSNRTGADSPKGQESSSWDIQKGSGQQDVNCNLEKEKEKGASAKSMKKEKRSAEPKTINAFQRVKVDEVKFADERLQDNSYWALDKSGSGYGAKAQEVLGQVRGRDFRHEKTKKKRGSYRGGHIDFESKSIKFDSDDD